MTTPSPAAFADLVETIVPRHPRPLHTEIVRYDHDGTALEGVIVAPAGGAQKAVILLHAWAGLDEAVRVRAQMVARLGFTAFAADQYGAGVAPATMPEMAAEAQQYYADLPRWRARVAAAVEVLGARGIAPEDIVVAGYCFGGTGALEYARTGAPLAGAVSFHGTLLAHEAADPQRTAAPLLVLSGGADELVPDTDLVTLMDELRAAGTADWQVVVYSGAPHAFTVPGPSFRPVADARSWRLFVDFLDEVLSV